MNRKIEKTPVGAIVGRFQCNKLHEGHIGIIDFVRKEHPRVIILLGLSPVRGTINNPLDYESRKMMILESYPDVEIHYLKDVASDEDWSKALDSLLSDIIGPRQNVTLYGGRDSFIKHYSGRFPTQELEADRIVSATQIREEVSAKPRSSADFRAGCIWSAYNRFPSCFPTVDIAVLNGDKLLLARKKHEKLYRFVGGFADPSSESYEQDARREVMEETELEIDDIQYIGSALCNDWRYANEKDKIKTLLFKANYTFGSAKAMDDICECRWWKLSELKEEDFVTTHRPLWKMLQKNLKLV